MNRRLHRGVLYLWCVFIAVVPLGRVASSPAAAPAGKPFSVRQEESGWWLVSPEGEPFFSLGVCVVTQGVSRASFRPHNPAYAAWQHYDTPAAWADSTLARLRSWRFTTVGGWSDFAALRQSGEQSLWLTPVLHVGSTAGVPWWDMWDPDIIARMDAVAGEQILPLRDDPRLLGYYSDNEIGWWNAALWKMTLEQKPTSGQRRRLIELVRKTYEDDWARLLRDFEPQGAGDWRALQDSGMLYLRGGGEGTFRAHCRSYRVDWQANTTLTE